MNSIAGAWFIAMVLFLWLEASTVGLVSIWFALGALAAMIVGICDGPLWLQGAVFMVVSVASLAALRPLSKKYFKPKLVKTNLDAVIGSTGRVLEVIDNDLTTGRVKLAGLEWAARSTSGDPIPANTMIRVDRVEGVKVYVSIAEINSTQEV